MWRKSECNISVVSMRILGAQQWKNLVELQRNARVRATGDVGRCWYEILRRSSGHRYLFWYRSAEDWSMARQNGSTPAGWDLTPVNGATSESSTEDHWTGVDHLSGPLNPLCITDAGHEILRPKPRRFVAFFRFKVLKIWRNLLLIKPSNLNWKSIVVKNLWEYN